MPIFGSSKRPKLDGLTKDEEKRRDALNPEVLRRAGEGGVAGQGPAAVAVLREKSAEDAGEFLWPCLLGWQLMSMRRYAPAIEAFGQAVRRDDSEVRGYYGAGVAFFQAGEAKRDMGPAAPADVAPADMTVDNLFQESARSFRRAMDLTNDREERATLREALSAVEKAVARKAGRL
jgi:hypothetical protein